MAVKSLLNRFIIKKPENAYTTNMNDLLTLLPYLNYVLIITKQFKNVTSWPFSSSSQAHLKPDATSFHIVLQHYLSG